MWEEYVFLKTYLEDIRGRLDKENLNLQEEVIRELGNILGSLENIGRMINKLHNRYS